MCVWKLISTVCFQIFINKNKWQVCRRITNTHTPSGHVLRRRVCVVFVLTNHTTNHFLLTFVRTNQEQIKFVQRCKCVNSRSPALLSCQSSGSWCLALLAAGASPGQVEPQTQTYINIPLLHTWNQWFMRLLISLFRRTVCSGRWSLLLAGRLTAAPHGGDDPRGRPPRLWHKHKYYSSTAVVLQ